MPVLSCGLSSDFMNRRGWFTTALRIFQTATKMHILSPYIESTSQSGIDHSIRYFGRKDKCGGMSNIELFAGLRGNSEPVSSITKNQCIAVIFETRSEARRVHRYSTVKKLLPKLALVPIRSCLWGIVGALAIE